MNITTKAFLLVTLNGFWHFLKFILAIAILFLSIYFFEYVLPALLVAILIGKFIALWGEKVIELENKEKRTGKEQ